MKIIIVQTSPKQMEVRCRESGKGSSPSNPQPPASGFHAIFSLIKRYELNQKCMLKELFNKGVCVKLATASLAGSIGNQAKACVESRLPT